MILHLLIRSEDEITSAELISAINQAYGISATALKQHGAIWKVEALKGIFGFRQMKAGPEKIRQLAEVIQNINKNGFPNLSLFIPTRTGEPFLTIANRYYILLKWYDGEHPRLTSANHLQKMAKLYGKLHQTSKKITLPKGWQVKNCLNELQARVAFLNELLIKLNCREPLNRVDRAIVNQGEYFCKQAAVSVRGLNDLKYRDWLLNTSEKGFCHNDPAALNIIIQNQNWILIDFELSAYDAFIREFAVLTARALRIGGWDPKIAAILKTAYAEERPISYEEFQFLPYLLCFPQRFWRLCSQRYEEKLDWSEKHFCRKLWEINEDEKKRFPFLINLLPELDREPTPQKSDL